MARLSKDQSMRIPADVYEDLYALKGPGKSFGRFIRELIDTVYPPERTDDQDQTTLVTLCPECEEPLDPDGVCPGCGYGEE